MNKITRITLLLALIGLLMVGALTGCERPVPDQPTPTARVILSPQAPPATVAGKGPTTVSVLQTTPVATPAPSRTIIWDVPTFTPTSAASAQPTATQVISNPTAQPGQPTATLAAPQTGNITHKVDWGDTLYSLAARYNTSVAAIVAANNLGNANVIRVGQTLTIPQGSQAGVTPQPGQQQTYTVKPGDTLYRIAAQYGTTTNAIAQANGIVNPAFIRDGQRLVIPVGSGGTPSQGGSTYTVQLGDTLSAIAARFGTTYWAIVTANNLPNANYIRPGQTLIIPGQ